MNSRLRPILACTLFSTAVLSVGGCKKTEIRSYIAPKDVAAAETPAAPAAATAAKEKPQLEFMLPPGWEETPANSVSLASFKIKKGDAEASVNITPLPNLKGRESMVVNMWRDQAGLPPIDDAELAKTLQPVQVGDDQGQMFEVLGSKDGGKPLRIVTAFVHKPDASWFYKLAGEEALVTETKPVFVEFLKTVHSHETPAAPETTSAPPAPVAPAPGASKWNGPVPEGWQTLAAGDMQVAKFGVPEKDGGKAEVFVSVFPNDTGGALGNVNRWRRQLGLPEVDQAGLASIVAPLDPATPEAILVDLKNESRAMLGAIVPRGGKFWFYKLMGDAPAVAAAREAFVSFAKSQP